jgi:hypothetical protein
LYLINISCLWASFRLIWAGSFSKDLYTQKE